VGPDGERVTEFMLVRLWRIDSESDLSATQMPAAEAYSLEGKFEFKTLRATEGVIVVAPSPSGMWLQRERVVARKGDQGLVIPVIKGGLITGRVSVEDSGFPLDKLFVRMRHWNEDAGRNQELNGGRFYYGPVPPGFVDIEVLLHPFNEVLAEIPAVAVRPGTVPDDPRLDPISLPLARRAELRIVDRAGLPIKEFTVLADGRVIERRIVIRGDDWPSLLEGLRLARHGNVILSHEQGLGHGFVFDSRDPDPETGPAHLPGAAGSPVSILFRTKPQTLRILAPGYLSKTHQLTGDAVVELTAAPPLQVTLDPELPGPVGPLQETTALRLHLDPEDHEGRPVPHVTLQGTLGLDANSRTFTVPTLGPGRYRLRAELIVNRGLSGGSHRLMDPCGPRVLDIGPDGTSLSLTFWPTTWAASLPR
jgi:hypothetical protein